MNRTIRTTASALGVGALLAAGLAVGTAVASPTEDTVAAAFGLGQGYGNGNRAGSGTGMANGTTTRMGGQFRAAGTATTTPSQTATASADLAETLAFTREEEKMARDLYAAIADLYDGARPFSMITNSEQQHYDAVGTLLGRYGIDDPAGTEPGVFTNTAIQDLYDAWWARAQTSLDEAYQVGIELEQRDIADLEDLLAADQPTDVDTVLGNLLRGSQNHLAAFQRAASGDLPTGDGTGSGYGMRGYGMRGSGNAGDCPMLDDES
jgi:hypothetical protein